MYSQLSRRIGCLAVCVAVTSIGGCGNADFSLPIPIPDDGSISGSVETSDVPETEEAAPSEPTSDERDGPCAPTPNGCGPKSWTGSLTVVTNCPLNLVCFTEACNVHDICYATCGSDRVACDAEFWAIMLGTCHERFSDFDPRKAHCANISFIYYAAVRLFGGIAFHNAQERVCACLEATTARVMTPGSDAPGPPLVPPFADADADLMPDEWEAQVGLDPGYEHDAFEDPDGDGLVNLAEYVHRTDPFCADSDGDGIEDIVEAVSDEAGT